MKPLIMKFGGTSIGNPEAIRRSALLVAEQIVNYDGIVVIVSALSGVTNLLIDYARQAAQATQNQIETGIQAYYERHARIIEALQFDSEEKNGLIKKLERNTDQFRDLLASVQQTGYLEPAQQDAIASLGERMSAPILAALLKQFGVEACEIDASKLIVTDENYTQAGVNFEVTNLNIITRINPLLEKGIITVVTGFIAATPRGQVTTLGRGASDYSSTIFGAALHAVEIWNWTDVDGVLTADPRLVPQAKVIPALSYETMSILAKYGAKVLHPETLNPIARLGIPLRVRNSFQPDYPGTLIQSRQTAQRGSTLAVVSKSDLILVEKEKTSGRNGEWLSGFELNSVDTRFQVCYAIPAEKEDDSIGIIHQDWIRKTRNTSLISVIGRTMTVGEVTSVLNTACLTILASSVNHLDGCVSVIVRGEDTARATQVLYNYLIEKVPSNPGLNTFPKAKAWSAF